ncbi:MAG TPA: 16S rRNA (cytosine(1402)-N(4))-methyltransferase RsmH [Tetrasphaera sp.]|uniref:16S rRNA (cytosine(1402)-N(4))-methyltransferase RsmH n=1 Tax=Nostocoides sp. TaxID=1917966 RepID=UPI002BE88A26|nr:16S rRNA (cytosine(1402)-N(4))-methyltransferase RsmH [Tetrasphaera sp.]HNQ07883.1 16S rRNA (cytosine(1402)-N(4))-methyltransferase RsmH [Tetrasphaera sp.]
MTSGAPADFRHVPVLLERIVDLLAPSLAEPGSVVLDATLGLGGHAEALLAACPNARLIGLDRDREALALAGERLAAYGDRVRGVHAVYDEVLAVLADLGVARAQAVLFDLGVSSLQLDDGGRGFAYRFDGPLDMRMDQSRGESAADLLATADAAELTRILRNYGEERFAARIARAILTQRAVRPITTSAELVQLLTATIPAASQRTGGHPGKRTFQALRIAVNDELRVWERALPAAIDALAVGGRIAVLSYHSLEDRITKTVLASGARSSAPVGLPVELPEHRPYLRLLTRGAEEASAAEQARNSRSASVRLRAAERLRETKGTR